MSNEIIGIRKAGKPAEATPPEQMESQQESSYKLNRPARIEPKEETTSVGEQKPYTPIRPKRFERKEETTKKQFSKPSFSKKTSRFEKPKKPALVERISEATNAKGEVFKEGDGIQVLSPWSKEVEGKITGFYKGSKGSIFAEFVPQTSLPQWNWEKGCIRVQLLKPASERAANN